MTIILFLHQGTGPVDGSSNIDAGVNIGTIFGIYQIVSAPRPVPAIGGSRLWEQAPGSKGTISDVLRPGSEMVAAGYTM